MTDSHPILTAVIFIFFVLACIGLFYIYSELKFEGTQCMHNPSGYFYNNIKNNNPEALITCSCLLIRRGSNARLSFNESGAVWVENDEGDIMMPRYFEGMNVSIRP